MIESRYMIKFTRIQRNNYHSINHILNHESKQKKTIINQSIKSGGQSKRLNPIPTPPFIRYQFLIKLIVEWLSDDSVLNGLLLLNKQIKQDLQGEYSVKNLIPKLTNDDRYIKLVFTRLKDVSSLADLSLSLVYLKFDNEFNQPVEVGALPPSLNHLELGYEFNQPLLVGVLPPSLLHLDLGHKFNQPLLVGVLPQTLVHLDLGGAFNQPLQTGMLPPSLKILHIGAEFNQPLQAGALPQSLVHLSLGDRFNQPLQVGVLPRSLCSLRLGVAFNQPLADVLPPQSCILIRFKF